MLRTTIHLSCLLAVTLASAVAQAQEFSADIVDLKRSKANLNKVNIGKDKVRLESEARPGSMGAGILILDEAQN